ncbi:hypothetical protein MD484_g8595, partial [Candolleomyces efflorescens]
MPLTTIFWPLDVDDDAGGVCYGWTSSTRLCVAGKFDDNVSFESALARLSDIPASAHPRPTILNIPLDRSTCNIVYYERYPSESLRFYDMPNDSPVSSAGLDRALISQLNLAHQIHSLVNGKPVRLHKPTAAVLLRVAATIIRPMLSLVQSLRLPFVSNLLPHSAFGKQLSTRAAQVDSLLHGINDLSSGQTARIMPEYAQQYTEFFNELWLILNDITLGCAFGTFLCENNVYLSSLLTPAFKTVFLDNLEAALVWLDSWPAGLKLNTELSQFYSRTFISLVHYWEGFLSRYVLDHVPRLILLCGYISIFGGLTLATSFLIDILVYVVTPHVTLCYSLARNVYAVEKASLGSLWALFRGHSCN